MKKQAPKDFFKATVTRNTNAPGFKPQSSDFKHEILGSMV